MKWTRCELAYWLWRLINHSRGDELLDSDKLSPFEELAFGTLHLSYLRIHPAGWIVPSFSTDSNRSATEKKWNVTMMHRHARVRVRGERDKRWYFIFRIFHGAGILNQISRWKIREEIDRSVVLIDHAIDRANFCLNTRYASSRNHDAAILYCRTHPNRGPHILLYGSVVGYH